MTTIVAERLTVRPMQSEERQAVMRIARRSFGILAWPFLSLHDHVFVAEDEGSLLAGIVLKVFPLPGGGRGGGVMWLFTDPEARGRGAAQALVEHSMAFFEEQGCTEVFACVEGYNSSSNKVWATRGFSILYPGEQWRRYRWGAVRVWLAMSHIPDMGHFLWARPGATSPESPAAQWVATLLLNAAIAVLGTLRGGSPIYPFALLAGLLVLYGARTAATYLGARSAGLDVRFRMWDSGYVPSVLVAAVFGGFFPLPGGLYPREAVWSYRERASALGRMGLAGLLPVLLLTTLLRIAMDAGWLAGAAWARDVFWLAAHVALIDTALPFFPFESYNGRRVWLWSKPVWVALAAVAVWLYFF